MFHFSLPLNLYKGGRILSTFIIKSFYKTIKRELIHGAKFTTSEQVRKEVFKYIQLYYDTKRIHSSLFTTFSWKCRLKSSTVWRG
ncbi:IS3 family transposase [Priestia megaterium]|uniref:IS3 family transposase n=1 Tax=Priestia megaterium TaxID=1404 RepID=UPI0015CF7559